MGEWGPQVGLLTFHQSTPLPPLGAYLLLVWSRQDSVGHPIWGVPRAALSWGTIST